MGMLMRRFQVIVAVLLVLCVVGISGIAAAQSVLHESHHHSHHQAATHGSTFCSWMCAAGQAGEAATVLAFQYVAPRESIDLFSPDRVTPLSTSVHATRGPPASGTA